MSGDFPNMQDREHRAGKEVGRHDGDVEKAASLGSGFWPDLALRIPEEFERGSLERLGPEPLPQGLELGPYVWKFATGAGESLAEGAFGVGSEQRAERLVGLRFRHECERVSWLQRDCRGRHSFACARRFLDLGALAGRVVPPLGGPDLWGIFLGGHFDKPSFSLLSRLVLLSFWEEAFASMNGDPPRQARPAVRDSGMTH